MGNCNEGASVGVRVLTVFERVLERLQEDGAISAHVEIWADGTPYISFSTCRGSSGVALLIRYMETR